MKMVDIESYEIDDIIINVGDYFKAVNFVDDDNYQKIYVGEKFIVDSMVEKDGWVDITLVNYNHRIEITLNDDFWLSFEVATKTGK